MALLECIWPVVMTCICQPLANAVQSCVQTQAEGYLALLPNWVTSCFSSWRRSAAEEVLVPWDSVVGAEETLLEIQKHLSDDSMGIIGICGMGGIGKTTLLQKINNDLYNSVTRCLFDVVIWVTVSQEVSIPKIQKQIGGRLGLSFSDAGDAPVGEQARDLFETLKKKQFLVLLDDVWEWLDLVKIGVPRPTGRKNCKVAFTTRLQQVCDDMDAKTVKVKLLDETRSWELLCSKLRTDVTDIVRNDQLIGSLAQQVVLKCGGLPLALITVGRAMARRRDSSDWEHAVMALDRAAEQLRGMDQVLFCLKFSYDYLENDRMRSALVFCAMYPEDQDISRWELIGYWDGEGLLEDGDDAVNDGRIDDVHGRGRKLINNLLDACLLEPGIRFAEQHVRLHDAVRDMLLWVNKRHEQHDKKIDRFLVIDDNKGLTATQVAKTEGQHVESVKRIWMRRMVFSKLSDPSYYFGGYPMCSWTLLLNDARRLGSSHLRGIFSRMTTLRVLDLSGSSIEELPVEISLLGELRYLNLDSCKIKELPVEIGSLGELRYLDLSDTEIMSLPRELGGLVRLRQLNLSYTDNLQSVPREAIAGLSSLQVLDMWDSGYDWGTRGSTGTAMEATSTIEEETKTNQHHSSSLGVVTGDGGAAGGGGSRELLELGDLEGLDQLRKLEITLPSSAELIRKLISASDKLRKCIKELLVRCELDLMRQQQLLADDEFHPRVGEMRFSLLDWFPWLQILHLTQEGVQQREEGDQLGSIMVVTLVGAAAINPSSGGSRSGGAVASSSIPSLSGFSAFHCHSFKELKFTGRFSCLEFIYLHECGGMEEVVLDGDGGDVGTTGGQGGGGGASPEEEQLCQLGRTCCCFPMLKVIRLHSLPALKSIAVQGPPFLHLPSLKTIEVLGCPELRRLPFSSTPPNLKEIRGKQEWWDALDWGGSSDSANMIKSTFAPLFVPY